MILLLRVKRRSCGRAVQFRCSNLFASLLVAGIAAASLASEAAAQSPALSAPTASTAVRASSGAQPGLARAIETQLQISFRNDVEEHERRREQVAAAVAAWRAAGRSGANDQLLADWLRTAIRKSMPGSHEQLPALPKFDQPVVVRPAATTTPTTVPTSTMRQKPVIENKEPAHGKSPSSRPAAEQSLLGHESKGPATAASGSSPKAESEHASAAAPDAEQDFWSAHPANGELPANLSSDPFRDDP